MGKTVGLFQESLVGIRAGTVSLGLLDSIKVSCYGSSILLKQVAQTGRQDNMLWVDPFDMGNCSAVLNSIKAAGFSTYQFSKTRIIVSIPPISGDEKQKIVKHIQKLAEDARISVRNIRKNWRNSLDKTELQRQDKRIQETTDLYIKQISDILGTKLSAFS
jgi:ribosome recycling factor